MNNNICFTVLSRLGWKGIEFLQPTLIFYIFEIRCRRPRKKYSNSYSNSISLQNCKLFEIFLVLSYRPLYMLIIDQKCEVQGVEKGEIQENIFFSKIFRPKNRLSIKKRFFCSKDCVKKIVSSGKTYSFLKCLVQNFFSKSFGN